MTGHPITTHLGPMLLEGYAEVVDYHVVKTGDKEFLVTFIIDIHMPEPLGGFRRERAWKISGTNSRGQLYRFVDKAINKFNNGDDAEWLNYESP